VRLRLQVRRFFCTTVGCPRRTFAERLPGLVAVRAQRTTRVVQALGDLGYVAGGAAGARLATRLQLPASAATVLRIVRRAPVASPGVPRVIGVDDFALRKGHVYGTLIVDLERRQPIDLLGDRTAPTLTAWLRAHPSVQVIARDRSTEYARGATEGAPDAQQVVDRWHVLQNLREAWERLLSRLHARLQQLPAVRGADGSGHPAEGRRRGPLRTRSAREQEARQEQRARRQARYDAVQALVAEGLPLLQIAQRLGISRTTARRLAHAEVCPQRTLPRPAPTQLTPYLGYLQRRWDEGCQISSQLWREIAAQGYPGGRKQVARWALQRRQTPATTTPTKYRPALLTHTAAAAAASSQPELRQTEDLAGPRQLVWLFLREAEALEADEKALLARLLQDHDVQSAYALAQQFRQMVRERMPDALESWFAACTASALPEVQTFAAGLARDEAALRAALSEPWSTGPVEGHITRVKLIKRQMFGRAKVDLLRQRVLRAG
jgi:transposase